MMTDRELMQQALEALELHAKQYPHMQKGYTVDAITALRHRLAQPEQEPVAAECKFDREQKWVRCEIAHHNLVQSEPHNWPGYQTRLLYTSPPAQRKPLTEERIEELYSFWIVDCQDIVGFARAIERTFKEKNNGQ